MIALKDWEGASRSLEDFRSHFPNHPLQAEVGRQNALASSGAPAVEPDGWRVRARGGHGQITPTSRAKRWWQSAERTSRRCQKPAQRRAGACKRYLEKAAAAGARPEARWRRHPTATASAGPREGDLPEATRPAAKRADRPRYLGASAAWRWPDRWWPNRKVALVEPLARNLKTKKANGRRAEGRRTGRQLRRADVSTTATFHRRSTRTRQAMLAQSTAKKLSRSSAAVRRAARGALPLRGEGHPACTRPMRSGRPRASTTSG